jgi:hypothetical protein
MKIRTVVASMMCLAQGACASHPASIAGTYVSQQQYSTWNCDQLLQERVAVTKKAREVAGEQQSTADSDQAFIAGGLILAWPLLFGVAVTKDHEKEFADLKGQYEAIDAVEQNKSCALPDEAKQPLYVPPPPAQSRLKSGHA